ncbi:MULTISPECIES: alanyl-tRNA editing protein [unclassified Minwuia]|jgi:misacylated tRNA(Ala) deacylase|uniref:alanyl-tRNA editing protein n=1 Tax=unclassified Minwuia TaxID=2618799 RepID=UPI00247881DC|nr:MULTISPECIES: alanyl-tRNA editing protein [unclassified Minwuia]
MTDALFRDDAYMKSCDATVLAVTERGGVVLDRTIFYPTGGGQPGDSGTMRCTDGTSIRIATTVKGETPDGIVHVPAEGEALPEVGSAVTLELDWDRRHAHMRMHTCLHLLSAVLTYPVTGGQVGAEKSRLDFDIPEAVLDKDEITAKLNELVARDAPVSMRWITDAELAAQPDLVKTMSVQPPTGAGHVRLIEVEGMDLQPCGGTHVARTGEIGAVEVRKIEKKGRQNRRVSIQFAS